jgi:hypothetical protein
MVQNGTSILFPSLYRNKRWQRVNFSLGTPQIFIHKQISPAGADVINGNCVGWLNLSDNSGYNWSSESNCRRGREQCRRMVQRCGLGGKSSKISSVARDPYFPKPRAEREADLGFARPTAAIAWAGWMDFFAEDASIIHDGQTVIGKDAPMCILKTKISTLRRCPPTLMFHGRHARLCLCRVQSRKWSSNFTRNIHNGLAKDRWPLEGSFGSW